jgi:hypothetical protein
MDGDGRALEAAFRTYQAMFKGGYDPRTTTDDELDAVTLCLDQYAKYLNRRISRMPEPLDSLSELLREVFAMHAMLIRGRSSDEKAVLAELESESLRVEIMPPQCPRVAPAKPDASEAPS